MNVKKFLKRLSDQPHPPCVGCVNYNYCEDTSKCCKAFVEYVDSGYWRDKRLEPSMYTTMPDDCLSYNEIKDVTGLSSKELDEMLVRCQKYKLAFEPFYFYFMKELEYELPKIQAGSKRLGKAKANICSRMLAKTQRVMPERSRYLVKEIRRNVWYYT